MKNQTRINQLLTVLLLLCVLFVCMAGTAMAAEDCAHVFADGQCTACGVTGGYCGAETNEGGAESVWWTLTDSNSVLTIGGTGAMADYADSSVRPWYDVRTTITSLSIEEGVTTIGSSAFYQTAGLKSVTIPASVTKLGYSAFAGSGLEAVTFADESQLTTIDQYAFQYCEALTQITLPAGVGSFWTDLVFSSCTALTDIHVAEGNTTYKGIDGVLYTADGTTLIFYPEGKTATSFTTPTGVTTIGQSAFSDNGNIKSVTLSEGVTTISDRAFLLCGALAEVTIPASVTTIGEYAFYGCSALTTVNVPCNWDGSLYTFANTVTVNVEHTPDENGYTVSDDTHSLTCTVCGSITEPHTYDDEDGTCVCGAVKTYTITFNPDGDEGVKIVKINGEAKEILHGGTFTVPHGKELTVKFENTLSKWETGVQVGAGTDDDSDLIPSYEDTNNILTIPASVVNQDLYVYASAYVRVQFNLHGGTLTEDGEGEFNHYVSTWNEETSTLRVKYGRLFFLEPDYFQLYGHTFDGAKVDGSDEVVDTLVITGEMPVDILWNCTDTATLTHVPAKDATCMEAGNIAHYICTCGKLYAEDKTTVLTSVTLPVDPDNHVGMDSTTGKCACGEDMAVAVVTIGSETTYYETLDAALAAADGYTATVKLLADGEITALTEFYSPSDITLDLNGKTITASGALLVFGDKLTITGNGKYITDGKRGDVITVMNKGTLTIENGTFVDTSVYGVLLQVDGEANIRGGSFTTTGQYSAPISNGGNMMVTGDSTFAGNADRMEFSINSAGTLDLSGVTANMDGWRVDNNYATNGVVVGTNLLLPDGYALKVGENFVTTLADGEIGTIVAHTHNYTTEDYDATHHWTACACGDTTEKVNHTFTYTPVTGKEVHIVGCSGCTYTAPEEIPHEFTNGVCVCTAKAVAKVDDTLYANFANALAAWTDGTTLTLLDHVSYDSDINLGAGTRTFDGGDYTLDLAGKHLLNEGTLTIQNAKITSNADGACAVENEGMMVIKESAITNSEGTAISNRGSLTVENAELNAKSACLSTDVDTAALTNCTLNCQETEIEYTKGKLTIAGDCDGWEVRNTRDVMVAIGTDVVLPEGYYMFEALDFEAPEQLVTSMVRFGTIRKHTDEDHTPANKDNEDGITHDESCTICGIGATNVPHTTPNAEGKCVCGAKIVAMVDDTCYSDFAKAVAAWTDGTTLTLLDDVSYDSDINLGAGTRTFAGGDHTLTLVDEANWIDNDGTLTIASGTIISEGSYVIQNSGTLNIEGGMVSATAVGGVAVDNMDGTLNITGGTVSAPGLGGYAIVNHSSMTLDGGTIEGYSCIENSGTAELKRGKVTASDGYALNNFGTATLSGADLATEGNNPAVFCSSGKTTISGGTLAGNSAVVIWRVDGTLIITTTGCKGWKVISSAETATIGEDITLPEGYYLFDDDGKSIPNLEAGVIGTITEHTHKTQPIDNKDGKSHDLGCACGAVSNQEIPHFAPNAEGKCVCGAKIVAKVDDTCYSDINVAINDWENNAGTLTLLDNVSYAYPIHLMGGSYIFEGGNFELDMDGYELNVNGGATLDYKSGGLNSMLSVYGTLNATGGTITQFIFNFGVVNLSGARVVTTAIAGSYAVENYGDLTISSGSLECVDDADAAEIFNAGGTVTIENTAVPEGWRIKHTTEDTLVLDDYITLPDGFYVFTDKKIVTELAAGEIGTITCHPGHTYICTADDDTDTITYACSCGVGTRTAKLAVPASPLVYDGEAHPATAEASDSTNVPVVTYTLNGQAVDEPINAGSYTATMTWGEASVSADITITPASLTAVALEGSRAYDATAEWVAPLEMSGVMNDDDVRGVVEFTLPGADAGEYTEATVKAVPELTGKDAGNYTLMPEEVSFAKATITRAAADKWNVSMASPQNVLAGSGLNAVAPPTAGTGIDGETVQITNVTFYTDVAMHTPAEDADISGLAVGESMTLYYVADAKNYESATGSLMLKAVDHLHEWHYAADAESCTIVATCGGTIGTCPTGTVTFKLVPPAEAVYGSAVSERSATCDVVPAAGTGTEPTFTYEALPGNAMLDSNGNPENAGEYKVTMALGGVSVSGTMAVAPAQIGRPAGYDASGVYNGQAHKPQVNYPLMTAGKDYTLTCPEDMVNAGRKTITVTGIGNYTGTVALDYEITKAILTAVTEPVDQTLPVYCADADAAISRLPAQVSYTAEDGSTVLVDVVWNCPDYDATPKATNTFTWTAVPAQLASCELAEGVPTAGTITVTGADAGRPDGKPPVIDAPDVDQEVTVYEGERGTMTVTATDAAGYQWYINRYDGRGYVPISGATSSTYITSAVTCDNNGFTYYCVVSNENGDSQSPFFTLKVPEKMDIPQTGDNSNITLWFALMLLSIAGLTIIMKANRKDSITR